VVKSPEAPSDNSEPVRALPLLYSTNPYIHNEISENTSSYDSSTAPDFHVSLPDQRPPVISQFVLQPEQNYFHPEFAVHNANQYSHSDHYPSRYDSQSVDYMAQPEYDEQTFHWTGQIPWTLESQGQPQYPRPEVTSEELGFELEQNRYPTHSRQQEWYSPPNRES
jgi:hypothetical protein